MKLLLFTFLFSLSAYSLSIPEKELIRSEISDRIQNIINSDDTESRVDIEVIYQAPIRQTQKPTENPFLFLPKQEIKPADLQEHIKFIQLSIFSKITEEKIPKVIKSKVVSTLYQYSKNNKIIYNYLKPDPIPEPVVVPVDNSLPAQFSRLSLYEKFLIFFTVLGFFTWVIISLMGLVFDKSLQIKQVLPQSNPLFDNINRLTDSIESSLNRKNTPIEQVPLRNEPIHNKEQFDFNHEKEEVEFFANNPTDYSVIHLFPSLGWMTLLSHQNISKILEQFTAEELAIAWSGPKQFLKLLASGLPLEKKEQVELFSQQIASGRDNAVFREIMICVEKKLREEQSRAA